MWGDKPYYSLSYYLKETYGEKVYKLSLDGGMTCPNRDGSKGYGGCIFCSSGGSGDFAANRILPITEQITQAIANMGRYGQNKAIGKKYIAYFQAFTNTYGPLSHLRTIFFEAIKHPDVVALSIATRPDCLSNEIYELLAELNAIKPVWIELGLQTIHEDSAAFIRRGYSLSVFDEAVERLNALKLTTIVHLILGLPNETNEQILESIDYVASKPIQGIKLQLLHVLKDTDLADHLDTMHIYSMEEYITLLLQCIERLPKHIVIHRITGDGPKNLLLAPTWSSHKKLVLNSIHKAMKEQDSWQGKHYKEVSKCNPIH